MRKPCLFPSFGFPILGLYSMGTAPIFLELARQVRRALGIRSKRAE